jgi:hypothetical protein
MDKKLVLLIGMIVVGIAIVKDVQREESLIKQFLH